MGKNTVKYGLSNVHIAKITETESGIEYATPFKLPGAVSLSIEASGETSLFHADNTIYYASSNNMGYTGELEVALITEKVLLDILGQTKDTNGAIFESSNDTISRFALMFEGKGDVTGKRFCYYDCTITRPSTEMGTTTETAEPETETLSITMSPRKTDSLVKCVMELSDTNKTQYDSFFTAVYEKADSI